LETERRHAVAEGSHPIVTQLGTLRAIGARGVWILGKKLFGWRRSANRRELAGHLGPAPKPYTSGNSEGGQGISKAGQQTGMRSPGGAGVALAKVPGGQRHELMVPPALCIAGRRARCIGVVGLTRLLDYHTLHCRGRRAPPIGGLDAAFH